MMMMPDWSNLPPELLFCVAKRMDSLEEYIVFGAVCKSWRSVATKENFLACSELRSTHQVPFLLLPRDKDETTRRNYYHLTKGKICQLNLSEIAGELCFSSLGWLFTLSKDLKCRLIHPLSHARIELPDGRLNWSPLSRDKLKKFVLSSSPSWTSNYMVTLMGQGTVAFCRPGYNENWMRITGIKTSVLLQDLAYYMGQFYVVDYKGCVSVCDFGDGPKQAEFRVVAPELPKELSVPRMKIKTTYLVESAGDLLVVFCFCNTRSSGSNDYTTTGCRVFKLPFSTDKSWLDLDSEVKSLGNRSLFLCRNSSSMSVEASHKPRWKPNCIYFMNNGGVHVTDGMDIGIFSMDDGQIERPYADKPLRNMEDGLLKYFGFAPFFETSHMWIEPSF